MTDSHAVSDLVSSRGTLGFYLDTLRRDPRKILVGLYETAIEVARFVMLPRFPLLNPWQRLMLICRWTWAELRIPGATTLIETIWLAYAASMSCPIVGPWSWIEVGCFKGLSTARLSLLARLYRTGLTVFDTFSGLPNDGGRYTAVDGGEDYDFKAGSYKGSAREVMTNVLHHGSIDNVAFVSGDVAKTLHRPASFAFLDVDLVDSYRACFDGITVGRGSVIVIHEACYRPIRNLIETYPWPRRPQIEYVATVRHPVVSQPCYSEVVT